MRQYKHLQMFVHANALAENVTETEDNQTSIFIRLGSDYKNNFYEYEIPLKLTAAGRYDTYSAEQCRAVWPEENMLDIDLLGVHQSETGTQPREEPRQYQPDHTLLRLRRQPAEQQGKRHG